MHTHKTHHTHIGTEHCRYSIPAPLMRTATHKKVDKERVAYTRTRCRCSHWPTSCPWRSCYKVWWPRQRGQRNTETERKRTGQTPALTGVCTMCVCECVCKLMAHFQLAALPLTQIKSGYLCLTLTVVLSADFSTYESVCMCVRMICRW